MSADNYYLIRRHENRYFVTCEFDSNAKESDFDAAISCRSTKWFDSLVEAQNYYAHEYSEYGVWLGTRIVNDRSGTEAERLRWLIQYALDGPGDAAGIKSVLLDYQSLMRNPSAAPAPSQPASTPAEELSK